MSGDKDYDKWLKTFYEGTFIIQGWNGRKDELLKNISDKKAEAEELLNEIGDLIGREWAKENDVRKINTDNVKAWGGEIKSVKNSSDDQILAKLNDLKGSVNAKLNA